MTTDVTHFRYQFWRLLTFPEFPGRGPRPLSGRKQIVQNVRGRTPGVGSAGHGAYSGDHVRSIPYLRAWSGLHQNVRKQTLVKSSGTTLPT